MVWGSGRFRLLPSSSCEHSHWGENQTTLCSLDENSRVRGDAETRIPSDDDGISSSQRDNGKTPLSLRETKRETQDDATNPRIRLNAVRDLYYSGLMSEDDVVEKYKAWVSDDEYLLLQQTVTEPSVQGSTKWDSQYIAVKCSKRGNDVYRDRVRETLYSVQEALPDRTFFNEKERELQKKVRTSLVSVTLTYHVKRCSMCDAWANIGKEFDVWLKNLRKKFGRISIIRTWEAFQNGYPHINAILLFHDNEFSVFRYKSKLRIKEKAAFSKHWHSYVDVQAVANLKRAVSYIIKYITKELFSENAILTRAMLWLFKKRSFSVSKDFISGLKRLDYSMHNSHQVSLRGEKLTKIVWEFVGIFKKSELKIKENEWRIEIPNEIVQELVSFES